jgi:hypothetical protein
MHNYYFSKTQSLFKGDMIDVKKVNVKFIFFGICTFFLYY